MSRRISRRMAYVGEPPRTHQCSVCSKVAPWGRSWQWCGSYEAMENGEPIVRTCSNQCRSEAKRLKLVPQNAKAAE